MAGHAVCSAEQQLQHRRAHAEDAHPDLGGVHQGAVGSGGGGFRRVDELVQRHLVILIGHPNGQKKQQISRQQSQHHSHGAPADALSQGLGQIHDSISFDVVFVGFPLYTSRRKMHPF